MTCSGSSLSTGMIWRWERRGAAAFGGPGRGAASGGLRNAAAAHGAETSWRQGRDKAWLWVAVTQRVTVCTGPRCPRGRGRPGAAGDRRPEGHERFFAALSRLKRRRIEPKAILIGYPMDRTKDDIWRSAGHYGIGNQVELHENIPPEQVNLHLNRAKVNVLWSRREGFNRESLKGCLLEFLA